MIPEPFHGMLQARVLPLQLQQAQTSLKQFNLISSVHAHHARFERHTSH